MGERRRIIEGTWSCAECDQKDIPGRLKRCPSCGAAREGGEANFDFGATTASGGSAASTVTDTQALDTAAAGADWYCYYCHAANRGDGEACSTCGATRRERPKPRADEVPPGPPQAPTPPRSRMTGFLVVAVIVVLLGGGFLWWALSTTDTEGEVTGLAWSRTLTHERFTEVSKTGWRSDLRPVRPQMPKDGVGAEPGVFDLRNCVTKEREPERCSTRTIEEPCGTTEVCEVKDLGNGFAEEVCKDVPKTCPKEVEECTEAVIDDSCTYSTHEWKALETREATGTTDAPHWPVDPTMGPHDRLVRTEHYEVDVSYEGEHHTESVDPSAFGRWQVGQPVVVTVNNLGQVVDVHRRE